MSNFSQLDDRLTSSFSSQNDDDSDFESDFPHVSSSDGFGKSEAVLSPSDELAPPPPQQDIDDEDEDSDDYDNDDKPPPPPEDAGLSDSNYWDENAKSINLITSGIELNAPTSFATSMTANYEAVRSQVETGMYVAKRVASVIKKINILQDQFAKEIQKVLSHELSKANRINNDGMKIAAKTWTQTQECFQLMAKAYLSNSAKLVNEVVGPLQDWHASAEEKRKELNLEERRATSEMAKAREDVVKGLAATQKSIALCKENGKSSNEKDGKRASGFFATLQKKIAKSSTSLQNDAAKAATSYSSAISRANKRQTQYLEVDLPRIFGAMQQLEQQRLDIMKLRMQKFALIQQTFAQEKIAWSEDLLKVVNQMDTDTDMKTFIEDWVYEHGLPNPVRPYIYSLPCTPQDIEGGRFEGNPKSVFRATLERCMELQKSSHPSLDVPRILPTLIKAVRDLKGFETEGIFRISVAKSDLEALHKAIDDDNYDVLKITSNPHAPAALLKEWLRLLSEPLIPELLYNDAIECVKDRELSPSVLLRFFDRLPALSRKVIEQLAFMAKEISTEPNASKTRMNIENLAIVFAPSFLRNPSDDPLKLLENSKFETKFTASLFKTLAP